MTFSPLTQEALQYYVYILKTPGQTVFYVGKGTGNRVFSHVADALESSDKTDKLDLIRDIHKNGGEVDYTIIRHGMTEDQAFEVEAALIDLYHLDELKNEVLGHGRDRGICSAKELEIRYGALPVTITDPVFLGFVTSYDPENTSPEELFHDTSFCWKVVPSRHSKAKYAFAVHKMIIREVYEIEEWFRDPFSHRWYFEGPIAPEDVRGKYLYKDISSYISKPGISKKTGKPITIVNQNLKWVNC